MYQIVFYYKVTTGSEVIKKEHRNQFKFRLRRSALHYLLDIVQNDYRENGYGTEQIVGGLDCYKSEKTDNGDRRIIEVKIKVEKV